MKRATKERKKIAVTLCVYEKDSSIVSKYCHVISLLVTSVVMTLFLCNLTLNYQLT
jgi:hypothetical protein